MKNKKVLVTGGAGYVGSVLVPKLVNKGYNVRVLDSMIFESNGLSSVKSRCDIVEGDIRDSDLVRRCLEGIDSVIHLAAISNDPCSDLNPKLTMQVNLDATKMLVETSKDLGVKRFIYASSSSVYGIKEEEKVTENLVLKPLTIYSKTKMWAEEIVGENNDGNFTTVNVRPSTVCGYSPRQRLDVVVNILTSKAILGGEIIVFGDGEQKRPNIHIDDMTNLYVDLLSAPQEKIAGETFNYGGKNHTVNEIAEIVRGVIKGVKIKKIPENADPRSYSICSEKIKQALGFSPKKTVRDAVVDLKYAFEQGLIPNPSDSVYRNIQRMKKLGIGTKS